MTKVAPVAEDENYAGERTMAFDVLANDHDDDGDALHLASATQPANGSLARYQFQGWLNFIATEIHKSCTPFFSPLAKDDWKGAARANLDRRLGLVNEHLADKPYLMGDEFSVADGYLFTTLSWMKYIGIDLATFPNLAAFQARVAARPAVQKALKDEGLA